MKLGNSNGNNRGKKYMLRSKTDLPEPNERNREKYKQFSDWFESMHDEFIRFLHYKNCYDEDIYYHTFLRMSEKILYIGQNIEDYKAYFHRAYYTNYILDKKQNNRFTQLGVIDHSEALGISCELKEKYQMILENDIFNYVYNHYNLRDFELFKLYINLKPAINYKLLSGMTSIPVHIIQSIISKILKDIRSNKIFVNRYYEVA